MALHNRLTMKDIRGTRKKRIVNAGDVRRMVEKRLKREVTQSRFPACALVPEAGKTVYVSRILHNRITLGVGTFEGATLTRAQVYELIDNLHTILDAKGGQFAKAG